MKTHRLVSPVALCAFLLLSTAAIAQSEALPNSPTPGRDTTRPNRDNAPAPSQTDIDSRSRDNQLSRADRNFFEEAAKSGMKEVEVSNAVRARLASPQVRAFAEMMVADHTAANIELKALASRKGVALPAEKKNHAEKWGDKSGNVDKDYVDEMEDDHEEAVELFEKASRSEDADIAAFAQKTLPKLQHHLAQVRSLKQTLR